MQLIFDNLVATLLAIVIFVAIAATNLRVQQAGIEQVSAHAAKTKALTLGQWLEDDITSLGANFGRNLMRFELPLVDQHGNTTQWQFYSDSLLTGGIADRHITRYSIEIVDSISVNGGAVQPLYQLERETATVQVVDGVVPPIGSATWDQDGRSVATLSRFHIGLVARDGTDTNDIEQTDYIRAEFAMVPEFERHRSFLQELYWSTLLKVRPFWQQTPPPPET